MSKAKPLAAIERADRRVAKSVKAIRHTPAARAAHAVAELADQPPLFTIALTTLVAGRLLDDARLQRAGARMVAAHAVATGMKAIVKHFVVRTRPATADDQGYRARLGTEDDGPVNSFPSGHTAGAVAVVRALGREYPLAGTLAYAFPAIVAIAQTPHGAHYPSDVAAGALIGLASEALVDGLISNGGNGAAGED